MSASESSCDVTYKEGVTYCDRGGTQLKGDLYLPEGRGPFPILIGVPGGGWRICVRAALRHWGAYLAAHGYGLFVVDYRLATSARKAFPEAVQDVLAAVRFVRSSADQLSIDPTRIGLLGASAGAHLASLAALGSGSPVFEEMHNEAIAASPAHVKALVAVCGVYDLFRHWQDDLGRNPDPQSNIARDLIGADPYENQQAFFDASPLRHLSYRNAMPVLVSWSTSDDVVDPAQSESFVRALQQARFNVRTHRALGASHFWFGEPVQDKTTVAASFAPRLVEFLDMAL
ncbi:MAG TPA: alpha/beta hydrolase [Steroidobacter sp.]|uniref:alpha/beta hydrolase n=1 Tax=Steroidobacter sp. TaxID=1978227 RepID=UPI002ED959B5